MIVQCSWKVADGKPVSDAVTWSGEGETVDLEDEIMVENCVLLEAPDKGDNAYPTVPACHLLLSCQPPNQIFHISVLCEARVIEVYGHHGEYLKTIKNVLLEEAEDMVVFRGDVILDRPLNLCSIKFVLLRSTSEMWLYGVKVNTAKTGCDQQNLTAIPLTAVEQRLGEMGLVLSDKAEAFKQLFERCQKSPMLSQHDIGNIIANFEKSNLIQNKFPLHENSLYLPETDGHIERRDSQNNVKEAEADYAFQTEPCTTASVSTSPVILERLNSSTQTDEEYLSLEKSFKGYVNELCEDIDRKMWEKISRRLEETEAKILCKLDEIESFVKPQGIGNS